MTVGKKGESLETANKFIGNYVNNPMGNSYGGAIALSNSKSFVISNGLFENNYAIASGEFTGFGGAISSAGNFVSIKVEAGQFNNNGSLTKMFGGVFYSSYELTILNATGIGNMATNGGVAYISGGNAKIKNSTFTNSKATNGGGLYISGGETE